MTGPGDPRTQDPACRTSRNALAATLGRRVAGERADRVDRRRRRGIIKITPSGMRPTRRPRTRRAASQLSNSARDWLGKEWRHTSVESPHCRRTNELIAQRTPGFILGVVLLSFVLLMLAYRSLLIPFKAAVMNLLSIAAAYGVVTMIFQWGWGAEAIGLTGPVPIDSYIPMMMFAVLFGLSMDYEVFLLTAFREHWAHTGI